MKYIERNITLSEYREELKKYEKYYNMEFISHGANTLGHLTFTVMDKKKKQHHFEFPQYVYHENKILERI